MHAVTLVFFVGFIADFFGAEMGFLCGNSNFSIGFSLVVAAISALNLVLHFVFIERFTEFSALKYME